MLSNHAVLYLENIIAISGLRLHEIYHQDKYLDIIKGRKNIR